MDIVTTMEEAKKIDVTMQFNCECEHTDLIQTVGSQDGGYYIWKCIKYTCPECGIKLDNVVVMRVKLQARHTTGVA